MRWHHYAVVIAIVCFGLLMFFAGYGNGMNAPTGAQLTPAVTTPAATMGAGTPVGRTPVVGYIIVCQNESGTWLHPSLVNANDVADWPPQEVCQ